MDAELASDQQVRDAADQKNQQELLNKERARVENARRQRWVNVVITISRLTTEMFILSIPLIAAVPVWLFLLSTRSRPLARRRHYGLFAGECGLLPLIVTLFGLVNVSDGFKTREIQIAGWMALALSIAVCCYVAIFFNPWWTTSILCACLQLPTAIGTLIPRRRVRKYNVFNEIIDE